jgi:hypothetical protein
VLSHGASMLRPGRTTDGPPGIGCTNTSMP